MLSRFKRVVLFTVTFALLVGLVLGGSYLLARREVARIYRNTEAILLPPEMSLTSGWWRFRLQRPSEFAVWQAHACEGGSACCEFVPRVTLSLTGRVIRMTPPDFESRLPYFIERSRMISYVIRAPAAEVRQVLPPDPEDVAKGRVGRSWFVAIPGLEKVDVTDERSVAVLWLGEPYRSIGDPSIHLRVDALDGWLRQRFPGRQIERADYLLVSQGLARIGDGKSLSDRQATAFLSWLEQQDASRHAAVSRQ